MTSPARGTRCLGAAGGSSTPRKRECASNAPPPRGAVVPPLFDTSSQRRPIFERRGWLISPREVRVRFQRTAPRDAVAPPLCHPQPAAPHPRAPRAVHPPPRSASAPPTCAPICRCGAFPVTSPVGSVPSPSAAGVLSAEPEKCRNFPQVFGCSCNAAPDTPSVPAALRAAVGPRAIPPPV